MRDYGTGSISQRKDGTWTARIKIGAKEDGKPIIKAFYGHTQSEVKRKLKDFMKSSEANSPDVVRKQTVETFMTTWLTSRARPSCKSEGRLLFTSISKAIALAARHKNARRNSGRVCPYFVLRIGFLSSTP